jgi:hypothetical protein
MNTPPATSGSSSAVTNPGFEITFDFDDGLIRILTDRS